MSLRTPFGELDGGHARLKRLLGGRLLRRWLDGHLVQLDERHAIHLLDSQFVPMCIGNDLVPEQLLAQLREAFDSQLRRGFQVQHHYPAIGIACHEVDDRGVTDVAGQVDAELALHDRITLDIHQDRKP